MKKTDYLYENELDEDAYAESKAEARNIIRAFIRTENDAEEIKSKYQNKKPVLFNEGSTNQRRTSENNFNPNDLDKDMQLAYDLINRRKEISKKINNVNTTLPPNPRHTDDSILLNMELRHAKVMQMKEERLKQKEHQVEQKKPTLSNSIKSQSSKLNSSFSSESSQRQIHRKPEIVTEAALDLKIAPPQAEILALKAKRQQLEQQSRKMEEDMKTLKENLRREIVHETDQFNAKQPFSSTSSSLSSSKITSAIETLQREADESRLKYNQYRLSKLVKAFNYIQKRQRKLAQYQFFESLRQISRRYQKIHDQIKTNVSFNKQRVAFSSWKKYVIACKDEKDVRFFLQTKTNENEFLNRASEYYRCRTLFKYIRQWKKFVKIQKEEKAIDEEKSILKVKLKGFISNLQQTIVNQELNQQQIKELNKQRIIQEFLQANSQEKAQTNEKPTSQNLEKKIIYEQPQKEEPKKDIQQEQALKTNSYEVQEIQHLNEQREQELDEDLIEEELDEQSNEEMNEEPNLDEQVVVSPDKNSHIAQEENQTSFTIAKNEREEKLKQIQKRTEERKKNAQSIKKKHEDLRKQKEEEKIRKETEEIEREKARRQEEYENFQKQKLNEKLKKENLEKAKILQQQQYEHAKQHHLLSIKKYFGFLPWTKFMNSQEQKLIQANEFNYIRLTRLGLSKLSEATQISQHLAQLEEQSKMKKAQQHYVKFCQKRILQTFIDGIEISKQQSQEYSQYHNNFIKRNAFTQWNEQLVNLRRENIQFEEQYRPIIIQFRKVVLLLRYFRSWKSTAEENKLQRAKLSHEQHIKNKVANWLTEFKSSSLEPSAEQQSYTQQNENESEDTEDINASQVKREALLKYYSKKKELSQNYNRPHLQQNQINQENELDNYSQQDQEIGLNMDSQMQIPKKYSQPIPIQSEKSEQLNSFWQQVNKNSADLNERLFQNHQIPSRNKNQFLQ